jgi:ribosomal protein S18 acetylase RimI-like enzyme
LEQTRGVKCRHPLHSSALLNADVRWNQKVRDAKARSADRGIAIRRATAADSERIVRLVSELGYRTSASQMRKRLESILRDEGYDTLVACDDGEIVGFIGARVGPLYESDDHYGQIMALAVAVDHQRRGDGRALIQAAESAVVERGARILVVTSGSHRADAHAFHENSGYAFNGRRYKKSVSTSA